MNSNSNQECRRKEHDDIVATIVQQIDTFDDFTSFRAACHSFGAIAKQCTFDGEDFPRVPYLMYSNERRRGNMHHRDYPVVPEEQRRTHFLNLVSRTSTVTILPPAIRIPYLSCSSWILTARSDSTRVSLVNFAWCLHTNLPASNTLPRCTSDSIIKKFVLSGSPESPEGGFDTSCLVFVIWGDKNQIAFCRLGETVWTRMDTWGEEICDIMYNENKLYAVGDVQSHEPTKIACICSCKEELEVETKDFDSDDTHHYLVKIIGKFHVISRYMIYSGALHLHVS